MELTGLDLEDHRVRECLLLSFQITD